MTYVALDRSPQDDGWKSIALLQGLYFILTGVWPLLHRASFEAVTGPKIDFWLVQTVGILVTVIGFALIATITSRHLQLPTLILAVGSAVGLAGIDVAHASSGHIARIYLLDAVAEVGLIAAWAVVAMRTHGATASVVTNVLSLDHRRRPLRIPEPIGAMRWRATVLVLLAMTVAAVTALAATTRRTSLVVSSADAQGTAARVLSGSSAAD